MNFVNLRPWWLVLAATTLTGCATAADSELTNSEDVVPVQTVAAFDLQRYVGLWYEIARIPNRFQEDCVRGTTAEYALDEDGGLTVVNRCFESDGDLDEAEGVARVVDAGSQAQLEVSFVSFLGWRPFWGDYWVLGLDDDYQWSIIGTPDRKYGWVLARTNTVPAETLDRIFDILADNGYRRDAFTLSTP